MTNPLHRGSVVRSTWETSQGSTTTLYSMLRDSFPINEVPPSLVADCESLYEAETAYRAKRAEFIARVLAAMQTE